MDDKSENELTILVDYGTMVMTLEKGLQKKRQESAIEWIEPVLGIIE